MIMFRVILIVIGIIMLAGCEDKAKAEYEHCLQLEQANDIEEAWRACSTAEYSDPNSKSGKAAAEKYKQLDPVARKIIMDRSARESAAKEAAQAKALEALRMKIHRTPTFSTEDDHCAGEGKPGHSYRYGGGTYDQNEAVAYADHCVAYSQDSVTVSGHAQNHFCCP